MKEGTFCEYKSGAITNLDDLLGTSPVDLFAAFKHFDYDEDFYGPSTSGLLLFTRKEKYLYSLLGRAQEFPPPQEKGERQQLRFAN